MVVLILTVAIVVGVAYGYNYSMAEFISLGKSDVTVYMRRGQFSDAEDRDNDRPPVFADRRRFDDVFNAGSAVDINNLTPDSAGNARALVDSWEQAKEARKYDSILSKFTPWEGKHTKDRKTTHSSPNLRVMGKHETIFFNEESRGPGDFYVESAISESVKTKPREKDPSVERHITEKIKAQILTNFGKNIRNGYDFYTDSTKSKTNLSKTTIGFPSTPRRIVEKFKHTARRFFDEISRGRDVFSIDITKSTSVTTKTTKKFPTIERTTMKKIKFPTSTLFGEVDTDNDGFNIETKISEIVTDEITHKPQSTEIHILEKFKPVYFEEDTQEQYNPQKKTNKYEIRTIKTTKKWSSTEQPTMLNLKTNDFISFETPRKGKYKLHEQSSDETEDYSESEEEDRIVEAIREEAKQLHNEKPQQTKDPRLPDVKIRLGKFHYHTSGKVKTTEMSRLKTLFTKQYKTRLPDIKIRVESEDYNHSEKNNKKTVAEHIEKKDYAETKYRKSSDGSLETVDESKRPDIKILVESNDYFESVKNNNKTVLKPMEKEVYEKKNHRNSVNAKLQSVDKWRTPDIKHPVEEDYVERLDRKPLSWKFGTVDRIKFDVGATRHPYQMEQPPRLYKEEDDDVMYKPV